MDALRNPQTQDPRVPQSIDDHELRPSEAARCSPSPAYTRAKQENLARARTAEVESWQSLSLEELVLNLKPTCDEKERQCHDQQHSCVPRVAMLLSNPFRPSVQDE